MYSNRTSMFAYASGVIAIGVVGLLLGAAWIGVVFCTGGLLLLVLGAIIK
jgi:hypothetical protein